MHGFKYLRACGKIVIREFIVSIILISEIKLKMQDELKNKRTNLKKNLKKYNIYIITIKNKIQIQKIQIIPRSHDISI